MNKLTQVFVLKEKRFYTVFFIFLVSLLAFLLYRIQGEAFFWDEAWSYLRTIDYLANRPVTINPTTLDPEISRAHPLLFYLVQSFFYKTVSSTPFAMHLFTISIHLSLMLLLVYQLKQFFSNQIALLFTICFLLQEVILVQFPMVLPEVSIALLSMLAIVYYLRRKMAFLCLCLLALVFIKESSVVVLITLGIFLLNDLRKGYIKWYQLYVVIIPSFFFILHFLLLKFKFGWFIYPVHASLFQPNALSSLLQNIPSILKFTCWSQGRWALTGVTLFILLKYPSIFSKHKSFLSIAFVFFVTYVLFTAGNFMMLRYQIPLILICTLCFAVMAGKLSGLSTFLVSFGVLFVLLFHNFFIKSDWIDDIHFNSKQMMLVHQKTVNYLVEHIDSNVPIETHFLMQTNLQHSYAGYIKQKSFTQVSPYSLQTSAEVVVISPLEYNADYHQQIKKSSAYQLVKRFELNPAWCEIYMKRQR